MDEWLPIEQLKPEDYKPTGWIHATVKGKKIHDRVTPKEFADWDVKKHYTHFRRITPV